MKRKIVSVASAIIFMFIMLGGSVQHNAKAEGEPRYKCLMILPDGSLDCFGTCGTCAPAVDVPGEPID